MSEQVYNEKNQDYYKLIRKIFKWIILSIAMAIPIGIVVGLYNMILKAVNSYRNEYEYLVYFLPIAGLIITFMYLKTKRNAYSGENLLKSEVQSAAKDIPFYMTFVVFIGSLLTTICGGYAGKEGSAVAISLEYFGGEEMVAIIIVMTVSYIISGFYDILTKRKIPEGKGKIFEGKVHKNK